MTRRELWAASAALASGCAAAPPRESAEPPPETARSHNWHLRYAPRIGLLGEDVSALEHLAIYADYGFDAFEYNGLPRNHSIEECERIRRRMDDLEMEMGVFVVNSGGWQGDALVDKRFHEAFLKDVQQALAYHEVMGNRWATVTTGLAVDYLAPEAQTANTIEGLKKAAEIVADSDLTLVLEPLNTIVDHAGYFLVRSEHAAEIIDGVGSERVRMLFDIYHQQISEGNLIHNIDKHWNRIGYFQVGDVPGRREPYTGEIRYQALFRKIYENGYQGMLGMEHGLSGSGRSGLEKCFEAYRRADTWSDPD